MCLGLGMPVAVTKILGSQPYENEPYLHIGSAQTLLCIDKRVRVAKILTHTSGEVAGETDLGAILLETAETATFVLYPSAAIALRSVVGP